MCLGKKERTRAPGKNGEGSSLAISTDQRLQGAPLPVTTSKRVDFKRLYYPDDQEQVEGQVVELMIAAGPYTVSDDLRFAARCTCGAERGCLSTCGAERGYLKAGMRA